MSSSSSNAPDAIGAPDAELGLSAADLAAFSRDGFLVLPAHFSADEVAAQARAFAALVARFEAEGAGQPGGAGVFTTEGDGDGGAQARSRDAYFLASGDTVAPFLEPAAVLPGGGLRPGLTLLGAINKIGHALHELEPAFRAASQSPRVAAICRALGYRAPAVAQSMLIVKPAKVGGAVPPHVDGAFLHTTPQSVLGFWSPLERATVGNGCLWAVPGSHRSGAVRRLFRRTADGTGTEFLPPAAEDFDTAGAVPLEMAAGDLVLLHAALVHFSAANTSEQSRHSFSWHVVEMDGAAYDADNWLQRAAGPFPTLYRQ